MQDTDARGEWIAAAVVLVVVAVAIGAALVLSLAEQPSVTTPTPVALVTDTATPGPTQPVIILPTRTPQPSTETATASPTATATVTATMMPTPTVTLPATVTAMPTAGATLACEPPPAGWVQYTVRQGDSLYALSRRFGTTVEALQRANCLAGARIYAGQRLWTPPGTAPATPTGAPTTAPTTALPQIDPTQAVIIDPCSNPLAHISAPGYGAQVGGIFWLYGAANIPNFMRYEIDVRRDGSATWMHLGSDRTPVEAGELAQVDPARFGSGAFWIRLTVVDKTYNYPPRCTILVYFP